jgi:spectinomycin phosphotransferase
VTRPPDRHVDDVAALLRSAYGILAARLEPAERGKDFFASVYRVFVDGPIPSYVVKVRHADAARDIAAAVARSLADAGVSGVVAPVRTRSGDVSATKGELSVAVYPFIDGRMEIEMAMSDESWRGLGRFARRLHETPVPAALAGQLRRETFVPPELETIQRLDASIATATSGDETSGLVVDLWRTHRTRILALPERAATLGDALRRRALPSVTCHADLHTGNLIVDAADMVWVIDWDEVTLAPKERDLMFAVEGGISTELVDANATARFLEGYGDTDVDEQALAYYRHAWAVQDVGGYAWRVLLDRSATRSQRDDAASILVGLFRPGEIVDLAERAI